MKQFNFYILTILIGFVLSCNDSKTDDPQTPVDTKTIVAKWNVSDAASPFKSIELNKSAQAIVLKVSGEYKSYSYKALDTKKFEIKDFGTIELTDPAASTSSMSFKPVSGAAQITVNASKVNQVVNTSTNTQNICKTWKLEKLDSNGVEYINLSSYLLTATFTEYGTYFIKGTFNLYDTDSIVVDPDYTNMSWWNWRNSDQSEFCYNRDTVITSCGSQKFVKIISNNGTNAVFEESFSIGSEVTIFKYTLTAYTLGGRAAVNNIRPFKSPRFPKNTLFSK